jgi:hypothetical protein
MAKAVCKFDEQTQTSSSQMKCIQFVNLCITDADVLCVVLRQALSQVQQETTEETPDELSQAPETANADDAEAPVPTQASQWMPIKGLLKHRRQKGKDFFLVAWEGSDQKDWMEKKIITDAALQDFYEKHKPQTKRRRYY